MCGISGKVQLNSEKVNYFDIKSMNDVLVHRGPDDGGIFISTDEKVGLGNRRLSIIDLSQNGHQPMIYKNKYFITYNGEVYNFKNEKKELIKSGYKFQSRNDTEVILALYDKYKYDCLKHLRGMFAFAIYDKQKQTIFLARDRIGKKPLKYYFNDGVFIFASELKAILTQKEVKKTIDYKAIYDYLTLGYVAPPQTGFTNINKLEPGSFLILDIKNKKLTKESYWVPDYSVKLNLSEDEWQRSILAKLREAVRLRMISDVPIGAFLSGGVDSSTIVALMSQISPNPIKTFTIGFKDEQLDESKYAENIAKRYKTEHRLLFAEPEDIEILPELARSYEEPFADASNVVTHLISKLAKKHVTVILNGDGGDENFVGYERYERVQRDYLIDHYLTFAKPALSNSSTSIAKIFRNTKTIKRFNNFFKKTQLPFSDRYGSYIQYFSESDKKGLYKKQPTEFEPTFQLIGKVFKDCGNIDLRDKALYWDLTRYLPEDLLAKVDIASMNVSLEARSPFLDQELIELACKIPFSLKYRNGQYKYILKKTIKELVPDENVYRRKAGFTIPLDRWFEGSLNDYTQSILLKKNSFVTSLFNANCIKEMLKKHSINTDFGPRLWSLLSLELWHTAYFK